MTSTRLAMPVMEQDLKCLRIAHELQRVCPAAFEFVMRFARDNDLAVDVRRVVDQQTGCVPKSGPEAAVQTAETGASASVIRTLATGATRVRTFAVAHCPRPLVA
jgi:hypothetical protein